MGWTKENSSARIKKEAGSIGEIEVKKLDRSMELENLSVTKCREIHGAHVYMPVVNFSTLVADEDLRQRGLPQAAALHPLLSARALSDC